MAKRRLTQRQQERIRYIQQQRAERSRRKSERLAQQLGAGELGPEQSGLLVANYGATLDVEAADGTLHRCVPRQNLEPLVVGDRVIWQPAAGDSGVVVALEPRGSVLSRPGPTGELRPVAANVDLILVVVAPRPHYDLGLIDQYLVAAEHAGIHPALVLNKVDLIDPPERGRIDRDLGLYRRLGYTLLHASTHANHGLDELLQALQGHTSVFAGQSGVGKSSLVNALVPHAAEAVGALSDQSGLGRHTTSTARLYHLPGGSDIIDSPGVREFRLWPLPPRELAEGFVELREYLGTCRFRDCRHQAEPGCALREAVAAGAVDSRRLENYLQLAQGMETELNEYR